MAVAKTADGFVATPEWLVDEMVGRLFAGRQLSAADHVVDPGCGAGDFISGVLRYCERTGARTPRVTGVEMDASRAQTARTKFVDCERIQIIEADFLFAENVLAKADYVIGNPPYVSLVNIAVADRERMRRRFATATGRFDLYMLFFERSLGLLNPGGRMSLVTPEKWLYVASAKRLRQLIAAQQIERLAFVAEDAFPGYVTYPLVTQISKAPPRTATVVEYRDGSDTAIQLSTKAQDWPSLRAKPIDLGEVDGSTTLADLCERIGCGPATGLDEVFVQPATEIPAHLRSFARPTLSGRQLNGAGNPVATEQILMPYDERGRLLDEVAAEELLRWLSPKRTSLEARSCAQRKPWYAFHETPAMHHLLRPKLLCKDITPAPKFYFDRRGSIVPRHSVYYLVPKEGISLDELFGEVSKPESLHWLAAHAQRAANGYLRIQSTLLKRLPVSIDVGRRELFLEDQLQLSL